MEREPPIKNRERKGMMKADGNKCAKSQSQIKTDKRHGKGMRKDTKQNKREKRCIQETNIRKPPRIHESEKEKGRKKKKCTLETNHLAFARILLINLIIVINLIRH